MNLPSTVLTVQPGASGALPFTVRNVASVVVSFTFEVLGPAGSWSRVEPAELAMLPGEQKDATLIFAPPKVAQVGAGTYPVGLRIISRNDPGANIVEETTVELAPFGELTAVVTPQTAQAGASARVRVRVDNHGNAPRRLALSASDPDELLDFRFDRTVLDIPAGSSAEAGITISHRRRTVRGPDSRHRYLVSAATDGASVTASGELVQRPQVPAWAPKAAATVVGLLVLGGAALVLANRGGGQKLIAGEGTSSSTTVTAPATSAGTSSSTSGSTPSSPPTASSTTASSAPSSSTTATTAKAPLTSPDLACKTGFVFREAGLFDRVCVTKAVHDQVLKDNLAAAATRAGSGSAGPDTCKNGFVWREAFPLDRTCVVDAQRTQAKLDNDAAPNTLIEPNVVFACKPGLVARNAVPGDYVCVTVATRSQVRTDNADALKNWNSAGGPAGPDTCKNGFVWREAYPVDHVCVVVAQRDQAAADNLAMLGNFASFPGRYSCTAGLVQRQILASDLVCVPAQVKGQAVKDNVNAATNFVYPPGAQGFLTCKTGLQARGAFATDVVCVAKADHDQALSDSAEAIKRWVG